MQPAKNPAKNDAWVADALKAVAEKMRAWDGGAVDSTVDSTVDSIGCLTVTDLTAWAAADDMRIEHTDQLKRQGVEGRFRTASREDLLVAFKLSAAAAGPAVVTIVIGGRLASRVAIKPGEWAYALRGRFPVPTCALQYHEVLVNVWPPEAEAHVQAVQTVLDENVRTIASVHGFRAVDGSETLIVNNGMFRMLYFDTVYPEHTLSDMTCV